VINVEGGKGGERPSIYHTGEGKRTLRLEEGGGDYKKKKIAGR